MRVVIPEDVERAGRSAFYRKLIRAGNTPRFAEMLALQSAPKCMTDNVLYHGIGTLDKQIPNKQQLKKLIAAAKRNGYTPNANDYYMPSIANKFGDPKAFVSGGRGQVKKVLEQRGWESEGAVTTKGREPETDPWVPKHKLHPKVVREIERKRIRQNPALALKDRRELREEIVATHGHK